MSTRRAWAWTLVCLILAGCGGDASERTEAEVAPQPQTGPGAPPAPAARPGPPPSPPDAPAVPRAEYLDALDAYCAATVRALERLADTAVDERRPVRPIATLSRRYRAALDELGRITPPVALRQLHLLTLAQGRESADRIDDGVRLGRAGDIDAATTALGELQSLLPQLPDPVRRDAPACA